MKLNKIGLNDQIIDKMNYYRQVFSQPKLLLSSIVLLVIPLSCANPPKIDISHNMRILKLPNNTRVGSIIYRIRGSDADNDFITFGVRGIIGQKMLVFKSVNFYEADVYLKSPLEVSLISSINHIMKSVYLKGLRL